MKILATICAVFVVIIGCDSGKKSETEETAAEKGQDMISPAGANSSLPHLIQGEDGNLYLSWVEKRDSNWVDLKYARLIDGSWTSPELIASGNDWFVNWADYPMIAVDKDGNMLAHFLAKSSAGTYSYDVNVVTKKSGESAWSEPIIPHQDGTPTEHGFVTSLPQNDDTFLLAWLDGRNTGGGDHDSHDGHGGGGAMTLRTAVLDLDGNISGESELDNRICDCCQTGGTITDSGAIFVYRDRSETEIRDMSFVRQIDAGWSTPMGIASDNWEINGCPVNGPRITSTGAGISAAWFTAAGGAAKVKMAFMSGDSFDPPIVIDDSITVGRVDVVMPGPDAAIVSWLDLVDGDPTIMMRSVTKNGRLGEPIEIAKTSAARSSGFPQMELINGRLYFAWTHVSDEGNSVRLKSMNWAN